MTLAYLNGTDAQGNPIKFRAEVNPDGSYALNHTIEIGGAEVAEGNPMPVTMVGAAAAVPPYVKTPLGYQQIAAAQTVAAVGFASVPAGATWVELTIEGAGVRWRDDGVAPTAQLGNPLFDGTMDWVYAGSLGAIRFINISAGAIVNASFYK